MRYNYVMVLFSFDWHVADQRQLHSAPLLRMQRVEAATIRY